MRRESTGPPTVPYAPVTASAISRAVPAPAQVERHFKRPLQGRAAVNPPVITNVEAVVRFRNGVQVKSLRLHHEDRTARLRQPCHVNHRVRHPDRRRPQE